MSDIKQVFEFSNEQYWQSPMISIDTMRALRGSGFSGVLVGAPSVVDLNEHDDVPVLTARGGSYADLSEVPVREFGLIAVMDLNRNRLLVSFARGVEDNVAREPAADGGDPPEGFSLGSKVTDLVTDHQMPLDPGRYLVTVILRERTSNRVIVRLEKEEKTYRDEEVERFLAERREDADPVFRAILPTPRDPFPCYDALPSSPPIPEQVGISLVTDRVVLLEPHSLSTVRGAFRLPALEQEVQPPREGLPTAVVNISLLLTGSETPQPRVIRMQVPSHDVIDPGAEGAPIVTGHFAVDLLQELPTLVEHPQTWFVYAFAGEVLAGPEPAALVSMNRV